MFRERYFVGWASMTFISVMDGKSGEMRASPSVAGVVLSKKIQF